MDTRTHPPRLRALVLAAALLLGAPLAAAQGASGPWSPAVEGIAVRLVPDHPTLDEGGDPGREIAARADFSLEVTNVTGQPRSLRVIPYGSFELSWEVVDGAGIRWAPTFLPPPMPVPGDRTVALKLRPRETRTWLRLHGISGFRRADEPAATGRWFRVLPAGRYTFRVKEIPLPGTTGRLQPPPVTIAVTPLDRPSGGLKLVLTAAPTVTTRDPATGVVAPVTCTLTLVNVGTRPVRVAPQDLEQSRIDFAVHGNTGSSRTPGGGLVRVPAGAYRAIAPGGRLQLPNLWRFPGVLGSRTWRPTSTGWYRLHAVIDRPADAPCPASACWTGRLRSNPVWIRIR